MVSLLRHNRLLKKPIKVINIALRSLLQHKLRTALSILGVICGVMAVMTMISIGEGAKRESLVQIEQLGTKNIYIKAISLTDVQKKKAMDKRSPGMGASDAARIRRECPGVTDVAYLKELKASVMAAFKDISPQVVACSANYSGLQSIHVSRGRSLTEQDMVQKNQVCVLGDRVAKNLGLQGHVGNFVRIENSLFKIIGQLQPFDRKAVKSGAITARNYNEMVIIPLAAAAMFDENPSINSVSKSSELTEIIVQVRSTDQVDATAKVIRRIIEHAHGGAEDYQVVVPQELLRQSQKIQRTFNIVLGSIALISLLVGGIGIMNIMLATVSERTREIGIRRSLGATQQNIVIQFLTEAIILTFSGGIIGIVFGIGGVFLISAIAGWNTAITILSLVLPLLTSILTGIFFGLYPAYVAAKMDPIVALRTE
jgi:putative ABC transport system permease protein